jgi:hypothetical protein
MNRTQPMPEHVLRANRDPALWRYHAAAVYAEIWATLSFHEPRVVKVGHIAELLCEGDAKLAPKRARNLRRDVRRALKLLVEQQYLTFSHRDSNGRGHYQLFDRRAVPRTAIQIAEDEKRGAPRPPVAG